MFLIHSLPLRTELSAVEIYSLNLSLQLDFCPELYVSSVSPLPSFLSPLSLSLHPYLPVCLCIFWAELSILKFIIPKQNTLACSECVSTCLTPCSSRYRGKHASLHIYIHTYPMWRCHLVSIFVYLKAFFSPKTSSGLEFDNVLWTENCHKMKLAKTSLFSQWKYLEKGVAIFI